MPPREPCAGSTSAPTIELHPHTIILPFLFSSPSLFVGGGLVYIHVHVGVCMCVEAGVDLMSSPFAVHLMFLDRLSLIPEFTDSKR